MISVQRKSRILVVLAIIMITSFVTVVMPFTAVGQEKVTIQWWHWIGWQEDLWAEAMEGFGQSQPNIRVVQKIISQEHFWEALRAGMLTGEGADVFNTVDGAQLANHVAKGEVVDLATVMDDEWRAAFNAPTMGIMTESGVIATNPFCVNGMMVWYRKPIFEENGFEVPVTMDELKDISIKLRAQGLIPMSLSTLNAERSAELFLPFAHSMYPELTYAANQKRQYELLMREEFIDVWEAVNDYMVVNKIAIEGSNGLGDLEAERPFVITKDAAMVYMGNWHTRTMREMDPEGFKDIGVFPFPAVNSWLKPLVPTGVAATASISSQSKHVKEAAAWIRWCTFNVPERLVRWIGLVPAGPIFSKAEVLQMAREENNHVLPGFYAAMSGKTAYPIRKFWTDPVVHEAMHSALQGMLTGELTPREAWSEAKSIIAKVVD